MTFRALVNRFLGGYITEAAARQRVDDFIYDYWGLCADVGPEEYARHLRAPPDADLRTIAYLAVWRDGPTLRVWTEVERMDAVDLVIDAAVEGFQWYLETVAASLE